MIKNISIFYFLFLSELAVSNHNIHNGQNNETCSQKNGSVKQEFFHPSFSVITSEISSESGAQSATTILKQDRNRKSERYH